jgi:hypothetical protein
VDEAQLRQVQDVVFDWLRSYEASHPVLVAAVEHFRAAANDNVAAILAAVKARGAA